MRNLLKYYLKKRITVISVLSAIVLILGITIYTNLNFIHVTHSDTYPSFAINSPLWLVTWTAALLAMIIPAFEFYFKMRKVSIDQQYQLPIKREKLYITKYIVGLIEMLVPTIVSIVLVVVLIATKRDMFDKSFLTPYFFSIVGLAIVLYTSVVFVYTRANTFFDGLINIALWSFLGVAIFAFINQILINFNTDLESPYARYGDASYFFLQSPMTVVHGYFNQNFMNEPFKFEVLSIISVTIFSVIGVVMGFLTVYLLRFEKAEDSMQKSTSYFSYKVLIPIYLFFLVAYSILLDETVYILMPVIVIGGYILYVIYNRSFKITKTDLICFGSSIAGGIVIGFIIAIVDYYAIRG